MARGACRGIDRPDCDTMGVVDLSHREQHHPEHRPWPASSWREKDAMTLCIALLGTGGIAQHAFVPAVHAVLETQEIGPVRYARALLITLTQDPRGWRAHSEQARYWALSAVGTHLIDVWRWYFGEPASVGGGLASPVYQSPNDEVATLV